MKKLLPFLLLAIVACKEQPKHFPQPGKKHTDTANIGVESQLFVDLVENKGANGTTVFTVDSIGVNTPASNILSIERNRRVPDKPIQHQQRYLMYKPLPSKFSQGSGVSDTQSVAQRVMKYLGISAQNTGIPDDRPTVQHPIFTGTEPMPSHTVWNFWYKENYENSQRIYYYEQGKDSVGVIFSKYFGCDCASYIEDGNRFTNDDDIVRYIPQARHLKYSYYEDVANGNVVYKSIPFWQSISGAFYTQGTIYVRQNKLIHIGKLEPRKNSGTLLIDTRNF